MGYSKEEAIKKIEEQQGDSPSFEIFTSEEHVTFLENHVTDQLDKSIGDNAQGGEKTAIRKAFDSSLYKVHQQYEDDLFEKTGIRKEKNIAPYTAEDLIRERLSSIIDDGIQLLGTGVKPKLNKDKDGKDDILIDIPDSVVTTEDLHKHLVGLSLSRNSKEYQKAWEKYSPDLKRPGF